MYICTYIQDINKEGLWEDLGDPKFGDVVMVCSPFVTGDGTVQLEIQAGMKGSVHSVDSVGDIKVWFPGILSEHYQHFPWWFSVRWVFAKDFNKLRKRKSSGLHSDCRGVNHGASNGTHTLPNL
eukprot:5779204-Karenia_brevis.AAC.1